MRIVSSIQSSQGLKWGGGGGGGLGNFGAPLGDFNDCQIHITSSPKKLTHPNFCDIHAEVAVVVTNTYNSYCCL